MEYVSDPKFRESWRTACWVHTNYKQKVYAGAYLVAVSELNTAQTKMDMKIDNFKIPKEDKWRVLADDSEINSLTDVANRFKMLVDHCQLKARNL